MKRTLSATVLSLTTALAWGQTYFVSGSSLYSPTGPEARLRGVNFVHYDQTPANIALTHSNAARVAVDLTKPAATMWAHVQAVALNFGLVPVVGSWSGTCSPDPAALSGIVDAWVAQSSTYTQLNTKGVLNIANEWGPAKVTNVTVNGHTVAQANTVWRDSYVTAIQRLRAAGYSGALMVDAGACGQDAQTVIQDGAAVLAADPLKNVVFGVHVYSSFHYPATANWMQDYATAMAGLKATGFAIVLGEFGPVGVGPSPTQVPIANIVSDAEANGFGWMAWAMDDNNLADVKSNDSWFSMQYDTWDRQHLGAANFTIWGNNVVAELTPYDVPSVSPVYGSPNTFWCQAGPACVNVLTVTSPIGSNVTLTLVGNDPRITINSTTKNFAWWTSPVNGTYKQMLVMTDAKGHVSKVPLTLIVSPVRPS